MYEREFEGTRKSPRCVKLEIRHGSPKRIQRVLSVCGSGIRELTLKYCSYYEDVCWAYPELRNLTSLTVIVGSAISSATTTEAVPSQPVFKLRRLTIRGTDHQHGARLELLDHDLILSQSSVTLTYLSLLNLIETSIWHSAGPNLSRMRLPCSCTFLPPI